MAETPRWTFQSELTSFQWENEAEADISQKTKATTATASRRQTHMCSFCQSPRSPHHSLLSAALISTERWPSAAKALSAQWDEVSFYWLPEHSAALLTPLRVRCCTLSPLRASSHFLPSSHVCLSSVSRKTCVARFKSQVMFRKRWADI